MIDLKKTPYWDLFADIVTYLKRALPVSGDDPYWIRVCQEASDLAQKYQETPVGSLCNGVLHAIMDELGRIYEEQEVKRNAVS